ncbi:MAG: glycosyltransferase family 4 protein [Actinomycetota bacterium]|nr:glycosyltransferase family 4 protein [Actinomycetota bacterium]
MKVVLSTRHVYPFQGYGGAQRYTYCLAKHLNKQGVEVEVLTNSNDSGFHQETFEGIQFTLFPPLVETTPWGMLLTFVPFTRLIAKYLKEKEFDILHSFSGTAFYYSFFSDRVPIVAQGFGNEPYKAKRAFDKIYNYITFYPNGWWCFQKADAIASEGEVQSEEIVKIFHVSKEKIVVLPDGVDLSFIRESIARPKVSRQDLGLNEKDFVLINVNRLVSNKGVNYLIDALKMLRGRIPNLKLIIVGTGPEESSIISMIKDYELDDVVLHFKNVEDSLLFSYYGLSDLFVCPTLFEGLPLVVLEAMACGLPIVATNTGENPQVVKEDVNGHLVPVASAQGLAEGIFKVYENDSRDSMGKKSAEMVREYDWGIIAGRAIEIYEDLVRKRRRQ